MHILLLHSVTNIKTAQSPLSNYWEGFTIRVRHCSKLASPPSCTHHTHMAVSLLRAYTHFFRVSLKLLVWDMSLELVLKRQNHRKRNYDHIVIRFSEASPVYHRENMWRLLISLGVPFGCRIHVLQSLDLYFFFSDLVLAVTEFLLWICWNFYWRFSAIIGSISNDI